MTRRPSEEATVTETVGVTDTQALLDRALKLDGTITDEDMERCRKLSEMFDGLYDSSITPDPAVQASFDRDALCEALQTVSGGNPRTLAEAVSGTLGLLGEGFPVSEDEAETVQDFFKGYARELDPSVQTEPVG
jgi:hypothetical protein